MVSRNKFYHRRQREGETVNDFMASLREITTKCEFIHPEEMMRDQIILGMRDLSLQKKLLVRRGVTFKDVVEEVRATESSDNSTVDITKASGVHHPQREHDWTMEVPENEDEWEDGDGIHRIYPKRQPNPRDYDNKQPRCSG